MTLVSVLVASALVGIVAAILATLFGMMAGYMTRSNAQSDIDQAVSYIYGILADHTLCDNALRTSGSPGAPISWNYTSSPTQAVPQIEVDPDGPSGALPPSIAVKTPKDFSPGLKLVSMYLREPMTSKGEPPPVRTTITKSGVTYNSISARLVLDFQTPNNLAGGALRERSISLTLGIEPGTNIIRYCYPQPDTTLAAFTCSQGILLGQLAPNNVDCPADPSGGFCKKLYYVGEFKSAGTPICKCQWVCPNYLKEYHVKTTTSSPSGSPPSGSSSSGTY